MVAASESEIRNVAGGAAQISTRAAIVIDNVDNRFERFFGGNIDTTVAYSHFTSSRVTGKSQRLAGPQVVPTFFTLKWLSALFNRSEFV
jgi:hypothetical protein